MRLWRFEESGKVKDAGCFDDTFGLTNALPCWLSQRQYDELSKKLKSHLDRGGYLCFWKDEIFTCTDGETYDLESLKIARDKRVKENKCWKIERIP